MTPPPTDRLTGEVLCGILVKHNYLRGTWEERWPKEKSDLEALAADVESAQADRAERLEHALRLARPHLEFDCIDDEDQKVLEAARDTVDAALADAEGGT